jgi:hypothetical protein
MANGSEASGSSDGRELVLRVLGAIGTGIGIVGFVTFFGGVILFVRAKEAGLPATEAVAVVPKGVLVATGASFLVPSVLLAVLVVLLIWLLHMGFALPIRYRARQEAKRARELRYEADKATREAEPKEQHAEVSVERAGDLAQKLTSVRAAGVDAPDLSHKAEEQRTLAASMQREASEARIAADRLEADAKDAEAALETARTPPPLLLTVQRWIELGAAFLALTLAPLLLFGKITDVGFWNLLILVAVAIAAAIVSLAVYVSTEKFVWFGVAAFVSVGIYTGCATYFRTTHNPKVEPAAALRGSRPPVLGFLIADTESRLYMGTFGGGKERPRLVVVPRSQVTDFDVGPLLKPGRARDRAIEIARAECRQQIEEVVHGKLAATSACTKNQVEALSALLEG